MSDPLLIPFKAEHLGQFEDRDHWIRGGWKVGYDKERNGPAFTAVKDGQILGCAGVVIAWPGMGWAWVTISHALAPYGFWMTKMTKRILWDTAERFGLHRVEAVVLEEQMVNQRWIEYLGFSREGGNGLAQAYTADQKNVIRYEWVRGHHG